MQLVVSPVADQTFFASLRASNILIARKRRRMLMRFFTHAAGVCAVMVMAIGYLNVAAARSPGLTAPAKQIVATMTPETAAAPDAALKVARVGPL